MSSLPEETDLADGILDVLAHACVAWTMGDKPSDPDFQSLKEMYRSLPGNKYKAEQIAYWLGAFR